jgi:1,2-diacylglycerol 3-alpha-glucosyltransferase
MAFGMPVVSTAMMGTATVLRGALVNPEDIEAFATQLARMLRDGALRA